MTWSSGQFNKAGHFLTIKVHPTERAIDPLGLAWSASGSPGVESCKGRNAFPLRGACQRWVSICTRTKAAGEGNQSFKNKEKLARSSPSKELAQMKKSSRSAKQRKWHIKMPMWNTDNKNPGGSIAFSSLSKFFFSINNQNSAKKEEVGINYLKSIYYYKRWVLWPRFDCCQVGQARKNMRFPFPSSKESELKVCKRCSRKNLMLERLELKDAV